MPFKLPQIPGRASNDQQKQEASLDDILPNTNQKVDLAVLVAICIDHMRDSLTDVFDKQNAPPLPVRPDGSNVLHTEVKDEKDVQINRFDYNWVQGSTAQSQDFEGAALGYFNGWRALVLKRMEEALNVKQDVVEDTKAHHIAISQAETHEKQSQHHTADAENIETNDETLKMSLPFARVKLPSSIQQLEEKQRALLLGAILFMMLSLENYPAHSRVLMTYLCTCLSLPYDVLTTVELTTAATLLEAAAKSDTMDAEESRKKKAEEGVFGRKWKVGIATVAGAALIGITGGLAAPLILGVAGTIFGAVGLGGMVTLLGATIANSITIGALFGALGGRMTSRAMDAYAKEVEDFKFLPITVMKSQDVASKDSELTKASSTPSHKLRVAIGVSGWVTKESDVSKPWYVFSSNTVEPFALRYEQAALISLGTTLDNILKQNAYSFVRGKAIKLILPELAAALAPIGLLKAGQIIDNPFTIAIERSDKAGQVLAHALIERAQGERPVTLVGFSMGARVVFSCLEELAAQKAFGLVENAILIGSPVPSTEASWRRMRMVVAGRLVNVYTQKDMILGFLYRARNIQLGIAGLQAITSIPNVENKDVSSIVSGHNQYTLAVGRILKELDFADLDIEQVQKETLELEREKIREQQVYETAKKDGQLKDVEDENGEIKMTTDTSRRAQLDDSSKSTEQMKAASADRHA